MAVIRTFRDRDTERLFRREPSRRIPPAIVRPAQRKLVMLHAAVSLEERRIPPGHRLERLSGDREGQYSIRVNEHWRICFRWDRGDAFDVGLTDFH